MGMGGGSPNRKNSLVSLLERVFVRKRWRVASAGGALLFSAIVISFIWNEARKEIVFLCSNFQIGITEQSVIKQLDTGNFLRYERETLSTTNRINADSAYNFGLYTCVVELDKRQIVIDATTN
jgi:hypothetical protein